jgi:hypothetical protein
VSPKQTIAHYRITAKLGEERIGAIRPTAAQSPHGTRARYVAAWCRCLLCRAANSRYNCDRDVAKRAGDYRGLVSAQEARDHILALGKKGSGANG